MDPQAQPSPQPAAETAGPQTPGCAKKPRRGFGCFLQILGAIFLVLIVAALLLWGSFEWWARRDLRTGQAQPIHVVVQKGDSFRMIALRLDRAALVRPETLTVMLALRLGTARRLQPGEYDFQPGTPPIQVLRTLARGPDVLPLRLTFPEGWTAIQIAERLAAQKAIRDKQRFLDLCSNKDLLRAAGLPVNNAEGFLFPDTYEFLRPTAEEEVIRRMTARFRKVIDELGLLPGLNSPDAFPLSGSDSVILASIIEREARDPAEMPMISSVYHNRLRQNMRLESCATVRFALNQWSAPLTLDDLKTDSPYNTYLQKGLPPRPICNPGRSALDAAFRPAQSDYLFYVYRGNGRHAFSRTLAEHEAATKQYKDSWGYSARAKDANDE